jgi:hypothetical protein|tara:strand:+ start:377 stop:592 length:216 start_codon:yes stop_codon:yes gene_type:complete
MISNLSEKIAWKLYGRSAQVSIEMQHCVKCGGEAFIFIDELSRKEYMISGYCQACQDTIFSEVNKEEKNNA